MHLRGQRMILAHAIKALSQSFFLPFLSHTGRTTLHLMTHIKQFPMSQMSPAIFQKGRQATIHPFRACVGSLQGHQQDRVTLCHPCVWKQSSHPWLCGGRRSTWGLLRTGEWPRLGSRATPTAKHLCVWIIYCTNSHICISGHFQVTGALWFTCLCQTVLLLVRNRVDIKLVWMQVPSWIFKAAVQ